MKLLIAVLNDEALLDDLITGWLDIGITGATVLESTDLLQLISDHIPIFAGFRSLTSGGGHHNKTLFAAVEETALLRRAVEFLEDLCRRTGHPSQGVYMVVPLIAFGHLGLDMAPEHRRRHLERKLGKPIAAPPPPEGEGPP